MAGHAVRHRAWEDIDEIADYIGERNAGAGRRFILAVRSEFDLLGNYPKIGSRRTKVPRKLAGLRSWPIRGFRNYLIFYLPANDGVEILRILDGRRNLIRILRES